MESIHGKNKYLLFMKKKLLSYLVLIGVLLFSTNIVLAIEPINNELEKADLTCRNLGFKSGAEMFNCKLKLFVVGKEIQFENGEISLLKLRTKQAKRKAKAAENYAIKLENYSRSLEGRAYESHRSNSNALMRQGLRMLSGACTLGKNC